MRDLGDAVTKSALEQDSIRVVAHVEILFDGFAPTRFTTYTDDISFDGKTFVARGAAGSISSISEDDSLSPSRYQITLAGTEDDLVQNAYNAKPMNAPCTVWLQTLDESFKPQGKPFIYFKGLSDTISINESKNPSITVNVRDRLADWSRPRLTRYTNAEQQLEYPGDKAFEFVNSLADKEIVWPADTYFQKRAG